jgi:hypothetical protein
MVTREVNMLLKMSVGFGGYNFDHYYFGHWIVQNDYKYDSLVICKEDIIKPIASLLSHTNFFCAILYMGNLLLLYKVLFYSNI